ncbi:ribosomal protein L11 methyltransferase [Azospirillaceae bacterium]
MIMRTLTSPEPWRVVLTVPEAMVEAFADAAADQADAVATFELCEGGDWLVEATYRREPNRAHILTRVAILAEALGLPEPEVTIAPLPAIDWVSRSFKGFPPIRAGRYFIFGSHYAEKVPPGAVGLQIDAATAFGTGEHGSTRGCLLALDLLARRQQRRPVMRALDLGCGSAILGMAVARTWRARVEAVDIDIDTVREAQKNVRRNGVAQWVTVSGGDGFRTTAARRGRPYQLITANILARPLARMAPPLAKHLSRGGRVVLSGLLHRQTRFVLQAYRSHGLVLSQKLAVGEWATLILKKP